MTGVCFFFFFSIDRVKSSVFRVWKRAGTVVYLYRKQPVTGKPVESDVEDKGK